MNDWIKLLVKYKGKCATCSKEISAGEYALWSKSTKAIKHMDCKASASPTTEKRNNDTNTPRPAAVAEVDCFICDRPIAYTNCGFEADYDKQAIAQAYICNRCLEDKDAYQNYQQAFLKKAHRVAKVKACFS